MVEEKNRQIDIRYVITAEYSDERDVFMETADSEGEAKRALRKLIDSDEFVTDSIELEVDDVTARNNFRLY